MQSSHNATPLPSHVANRAVVDAVHLDFDRIPIVDLGAALNGGRLDAGGRRSQGSVVHPGQWDHRGSAAPGSPVRVVNFGRFGGHGLRLFRIGRGERFLRWPGGAFAG